MKTSLDAKLRMASVKSHLKEVLIASPFLATSAASAAFFQEDLSTLTKSHCSPVFRSLKESNNLDGSYSAVIAVSLYFD